MLKEMWALGWVLVEKQGQGGAGMFSTPVSTGF